MRVGKVGNEEIKVQDRFKTKTGDQIIYWCYPLWLNFMEWNVVLICTVILGRITSESKKNHRFFIIVTPWDHGIIDWRACSLIVACLIFSVALDVRYHCSTLLNGNIKYRADDYLSLQKHCIAIRLYTIFYIIGAWARQSEILTLCQHILHRYFALPR